jgi:ATP-dependent Clp protease ATP-binding subunit ClpA
MLARGELRVIGATTLAEYRRIERDHALARRFSPVTVEEPRSSAACAAPTRSTTAYSSTTPQARDRFTAGEPAAEAERMQAAAKEAFLPEFVNRIDEIVTFESLTPEHVERIAAQMVARVAGRLRAERGIELTVDDALVAQLARDGFDESYGARPLQRHIRRTLEKALTRAILSGELADGARVHAHAGDTGEIVIETVLELAHA